MALTDNQKRLIEAVSSSDLYQAKRAAIACVVEDNSKKNEWWRKKHKNLLQNTPEQLEVPPNLKHILDFSDVSETFLEGRYFLSEREKEVFNHIVSINKTSEKLTELNIRYLNAVLLYGPSGTGKTTFGKYVAYKMGLPFLYINFSNLIDSLMGGTAQKLSLVFNFVKQTKCVFMIDEIDTISTRRLSAGGGSDAELSRITVTLMQELDNLSNEHIVLGATNRMDMMDEALLRRFSKHHEVQILSVEEKRQMVYQFLDDVGINYSKDDVERYCEQNVATPQALIINRVIESIVQSVFNGEELQLASSACVMPFIKRKN